MRNCPLLLVFFRLTVSGDHFFCVPWFPKSVQQTFLAVLFLLLFSPFGVLHRDDMAQDLVIIGRIAVLHTFYMFFVTAGTGTTKALQKRTPKPAQHAQQ